MSTVRHALLITCSLYEDQGLRELRAPVHDSKALFDVLADPEIGDFNVESISNEPHYKVALRIERFFADRSPEDLLLLYISGHGIKDDFGQLYFAGSNTSLTSLDATALAADFVNRHMSRTRSRRVILFLDCCYAGAFARGMIPRSDDNVDLSGEFEGRGRAVLTASKATEYAFEGEQLVSGEERPSVFTSALVRGLKTGQADRDGDGWISFDDLYDYLSIEVPKETPKQTPTKWIFDAEGELQIAQSLRGRLPPIPTVLDPAPIDVGSITFAIERAVSDVSRQTERSLLFKRGRWVDAVAHEAAVKAAVQRAVEHQAIGRTINDVSRTLAMRYRSLVDRQLELIEDLQRSEPNVEDRDYSSELDRIDQLAARMRRYSENLVMLTGGEVARRWDRPVPLSEVVRSASEEVEDYDRISLEAATGSESIDSVKLIGQAVTDVVHLFAELLENATAFSPPTTEVKVRGQLVKGGYMVEVEDRGLGMSDQELIVANERLANPPVIDFALSRMVGFYVVGRLAQRYGIKVQLRHSWYGGVVALTLLPYALILYED